MGYVLGEREGVGELIGRWYMKADGNSGRHRKRQTIRLGRLADRLVDRSNTMDR